MEPDSLSDSPVSDPVWPRKTSELQPETIVIFGLVISILCIFVM